MSEDKDRYRPRRCEEIEGNGISLFNEPAPPDNVSTLVRPKQRPLHAVLVEALNNTQALLTRLETGVVVPRDQQRGVVRELYVQARRQLQALAACLELDGLE